MRTTVLLALVALSPGAALAAPAPTDGNAPAGNSPSVTLPAAVEAALGRSAARNDGPAEPLSGRRDPGFANTEHERSADQTYGSTTQAPNGSLMDNVMFTEAGLERDAAGDVPDYHIVQSGDTLWDISRYYLADAYLWPKLWSWNDHVTNAHWIFPGDRIRLFDPFGANTDPKGPNLAFSKTRIPVGTRRGPYLLSQVAFVDADKFDSAMTITGGSDAKAMMATLDTVYLDYDRGNPPIPGERLVVYSPQEKIFDATGKKLIGYLVMVAGDVQVESIARQAVEGTLWNAVNPVERGFKAGPLARRFRRIEPIPAETSTVGQIVATLNSTAPIDFKDKRRRRGSKRKKLRRGFGDDVMAGDDQFVVVDLGKGSGIKEGNVLEVVRKGDQYSTKHEFIQPYEDGWPRRIVGALLVVQVDDATSLAVTIFSRNELVRGDHVELRGAGVESGESQNQGQPPAGVEADANASAGKTDDGAKASGGFRLGD